MSSSNWMAEDALEGRPNLTRSRDAGGDEMRILRISGKTFFQLTHFLEDAAEKSTAWFEVRMAVLLAEDLRKAVLACEHENELEPVDARIREHDKGAGSRESGGRK